MSNEPCGAGPLEQPVRHIGDDEPSMYLSPSLIVADRNSEISGAKSGQMMLNVAYIFGLAEIPEIAAAIIAYGKSAGLKAMNIDA